VKCLIQNINKKNREVFKLIFFLTNGVFKLIFTLLKRIIFNNLIMVFLWVIFSPFLVRISCDINNNFSILINRTKKIIIAIRMLLLAVDLIVKIKGLICFYPPVIWASSGFLPCKKKVKISTL